jgi:hypothetical protein
MNMPFTAEEFFQVFRNYRTNAFPIQILLNFRTLTMLILAIERTLIPD